MAKNLNELEEELYGVFNESVREGRRYLNSGSGEFRIAAAQSLQAAAETAKAIVEIEREQREAKANKFTTLPGKRAAG